MRGLSTGFTRAGGALRNVGVAARCLGKAGRKRQRRGPHVIYIGDIDVCLGLDVSKGEHHATPSPLPERRRSTSACPTPPPKLPPAAARGMDCPVAYLPRLTMRRIADLYPGEAKDGREDRVHHRGRRPRDASHTAGDRRRGRDDRRAGDDRRARRRLGRRGDQGREPAPWPADPDPSVAGTSTGAAVAVPGRPHAAGTVRVTGPDPKGRTALAGHTVGAEASRMAERLVEDNLHRGGGLSTAPRSSSSPVRCTCAERWAGR